jgi:hypothetical protein
MGDVSAEPSMEEILSSIKRIIAEEGEGVPQRARRAHRPPAPPIQDQRRDAPDEVLELSEPMPTADRLPERPTARVVPAPESAPKLEPVKIEPIVSQQTAVASRGSLEALSRMIVKPEGTAGTDNTLESLVREMLRPMLREWLDARLPDMVEAMVAREIQRITGSPNA